MLKRINTARPAANQTPSSPLGDEGSCSKGKLILPVEKYLLTRREAAAALAMSPKTLARLEARGLITSLKALRTKRYTRESLLNFITEAAK